MTGRLEVNFERRDVSVDCRFFLGDRPCIWHKRERALCQCSHYEQARQRLLIIKLDAMGDVLRTTALLEPLREHYPESYITWVTRPESKPLLEQNPMIDEIVTYGPDTFVLLASREFDRTINLDSGRISAGLAASSRATNKDGYVLDPRGWVTATNKAAEDWLQTGLFDDIKAAGTRTYQAVMSEILGLTKPALAPVMVLSDKEREKARKHLVSLGLDFSRPIIGMNTGAGGRWPLKAWREDGYLDLIDRIGAELDAQFVLLGGPGEHERNERLRRDSKRPVIDPGCDNPVRHFSGLVSFCDVVITGDTLAMHIALAMGRRTVVLFGPTSAPEIELCDLGEKVIPDMTCLSCYKTSCDFVPNCMDLISTDMVAAAVRRQWAHVKRPMGQPQAG
jgi:ADP-heptose:LPS heptosyltransferase